MNIRHIGGLADENAIAHVIAKTGEVPLMARPCPIVNGRIHPWNTKFLLPSGKIAEVFACKPYYYLHRNGEWRPLGEVTTHHGNHIIELAPGWEHFIDLRYVRWLMDRQKSIGGELRIPWKTIRNMIKLDEAVIHFTTGTFYPAAGANSPCDGYVSNAPVATTWALLRAAASGTSFSVTDTDLYISGTLSFFGAGTYDLLRRAFTLFDTSSIGAGQAISSATWSYCARAKRNNASVAEATLNSQLVASTPAATDTLANGDFDQVGTVSFGPQVAYATVNVDSSTYNDVALNASGIANIDMINANSTKFGSIADCDFTGIDPAASAAGVSDIIGLSADTAGTSTDPKLVVVYSVPSAAASTLRSPGGGVAVGGSLMF